MQLKLIILLFLLTIQTTFPVLSGATISSTYNSLTPGEGYRVIVRGARNQGCICLTDPAADPSAVTLSATGVLAQGNIASTIQGAGFLF